MDNRLSGTRTLPRRQVLTARIFTANSSGSSGSIAATIAQADYTRRIQCAISVMDDSSPYNSASGADARDVYPELTPYVSEGSDTGNYDWNGRHRRDIWYQIWHSDSTRWDKGGSVTEDWQASSNPCELNIDTGLSGSVNSYGQFLDTYYSGITNPACTLLADQSYTLDKAGYARIHEQTWRFDNTGVWKQ